MLRHGHKTKRDKNGKLYGYRKYIGSSYTRGHRSWRVPFADLLGRIDRFFLAVQFLETEGHADYPAGMGRKRVVSREETEL